MAQAVESSPNIPNGIKFDGFYYNWDDVGSEKYLERVQGTDTSDNMRQNNFPVSIRFTDAKNKVQKIEINDKSSSVTLWFPVSNKEIIWHHPGGQDRTGFDVDCSWAQIRFGYIKGDMFNSNGVRIHFTGYKRKDAQVAKVDWDTVNQWIKAGKDVSEAIKNGAEAYAAVKGAGKSK